VLQEAGFSPEQVKWIVEHGAMDMSKL